MLYDINGVVIDAAGELLTLFHYTDEAGQRGILDSRSLRSSLRSKNPNDARYGDGAYLSDIQPGTRPLSSLSQAFVNMPFHGRRFTHYVEIDVSDLAVTQGRSHVFVVLGRAPLNLDGRIKDWGVN
ncbi:HYD1 signature containing ADP-ribosyltransferase family protein [Streptomyces sp. NPDC051815]|uniref:HYD1 signature containing ADP-ribosyltransferase family protein n=1 Tax=Streptomyces sp. NPDC051815 TaxID=3365674 RepID=UPI0037A0FC05